MRKAYLTILVSVASVSLSLAAPKDWDAVYNHISKEYTLSSDGSQSCRTVEEMTYYSYHAIHDLYGETFIDYNPQWQDLVINSSYTKKADGTIVMTPENAFVGTLPKYAENAPAHNSLTRLVVVHTGLEPGCTTYLDYTIISKPGYLPELDIITPVEYGSPVTELTVSITVPQEKRLRYSFSKTVPEPAVRTSTGKTTYLWTLKNLEAESSDPGDYKKSLFTASTFESEESAFAFLSSQFTKTEEIDSTTMASIETKGSENNKMMSVSRFLRERFSIVPIPLKAAGYRLRSIVEILRSAYVTADEREMVRCALLNAAGVKAEVVPVYSCEPVGLGSIARLRTDAVSEKGISSFEKKFSTKLKYGEDDLEKGYLVIDLPFENMAFSGKPYTTYPSTRGNDLNLHRSFNEVHEYEIILEDGLIPSGLENLKTSISNDAGYCNVTASITGNIITVTRTIEIYKATIHPAEYAAFRELIAAWTTAKRFIVRKP
ncbi:MAG: DUF3857 domain-containing protein [Bacteroidales bacterium]|nr:DUF3857 domain-containing protein [Bacteroidales bacterium]